MSTAFVYLVNYFVRIPQIACGGAAKSLCTPIIIREESLHVTDLGTQLKPIIQNWVAHEELRKCPECGVVPEAK